MKPILVQRRYAYLVLSGAVLAALVAACGGSSGPSAPTTAIQKASTASGDAQTGAVTTTLANPLRVLVTSNGTPQVGTTVMWATSGAGALVSPANSGATDGMGISSATWTLGQTAGAQTATASLSGAAGSPITFTATATPGAATQLALSSGDNQSALATFALANALVVKASDQFGNGTTGTGVTWQVTSGSATPSPTSGTTDANGMAQTTITLGGTAGPITITATSSPTLAGSPVTFHATAQALPTSASVTVGNPYFFQSVRNGSQNPAVDTIAAGGTVTWTWAGGVSHSVQSTGTPSFPSSVVQTSGKYSNTFTTAGVYQYDCSVHGTLMTGRVVVR